MTLYSYIITSIKHVTMKPKVDFLGFEFLNDPPHLLAEEVKRTNVKILSRVMGLYRSRRGMWK